MPRRSKLMSLAEAVAQLKPGGSLGLGGAVHSNRPSIFVRAVVRQGIGNLTVFTPGAGWDLDLLMGAGLVRETFTPMCTFINPGMAPSFRLAAESGTVRIHNTDAASMTAGYLAAAYRHPYHLVLSLEGTSLISDPAVFTTLTDPEGRSWRAVRAMAPDVCVLHVEEADEFGNLRHRKGRLNDVQMAMAAKVTIACVERIVPNAQVRREPNLTTVAGKWVAGVVEAPFGGHPCACAFYNTDDEHLLAYWKAAEARRQGNDQAYKAYLDKYIYGPASAAEYHATAVGPERAAQLRQGGLA